MANKTLNNVKINVTLKSTTTRAKLSTSSEDLAVQLGKINKWYDSLVPTGGASGNILGWNSDGTAKWVTVAPSANKLNVSSAVGGTSQPVYFKADGTPETISFTIEKSVPSSAVFTDEKVKSTSLAQSTAAAVYKPTFVSAAATGGVNIINSYQVAHTPGTTSAVGNTRLVLGNSTASGTTNNEEGQIKLYSPGTAHHTIKGTTISSEAVHVLPSTGGTILNTGTTSYTQTVASTATGAYEIGKITINGTTTTIYGKDTGTSYTASDGIKIESGVIKHTNSITEETSTVFKKFSYDAQGHITDIANVTKSDITALGIPASDTKYGISGAYGANSNTWVTTITAGGTGTTSTVPTASTSAYGITKLYNGVDSTSTGLAATANAVKTAYDKANHSHPYLPISGGTMTGGLTFGTSTSIVPGSTINIYTRTYSTYGAAVKWSNGDTWGTRGAEIGYHNTGGDSTNPGTICILPYQTDSNPWEGEVGLFIKKDHVYIDGVELSKTDENVKQTATTTNADYEVLFSATADNTTRTETARKNSNLKFNPSTGMLNVGRLTLTSSTWGGLIINRTASSSHAGIIFQQNGTDLGSISMGEADSPLVRWKAGSSTSYKVYDEGNVQPMLWRYVPSGDPASATDAGVYPAYTMAYMQGTGAFGGSTGRLGNSGTTYWAHYLTFTHNSSFRYILRFPFWGPPQFQHTNNDTDQKWSNFITDEHIGNYSRCMGSGTAIDPITGAMTHMHRANKLAFPPAANITVQISNDSGSTWSNLSVTDTLKRQIFSLPGRSSGVKIGPTSGNATTAMQTRIIFECDGRDVVLNRFLFGIGSDYHTIAIDVYAGSTVSGLTKIATGDASGTWAYEAVATIDNIPSKYYRFSTSNYKFFAFVFRYVTVDSSHLTNRGSVNSIAGYSGIFWGSNGNSNLANYDHMYSWDVDQNVDFPADVGGNSLSAPTVNVSSSSYKASVTASGLTQNRTITIGDVSGDVGIVKVLHDNDNYAAGQTVAITTAEKFKYFIVTVRPNNTFGEKTEIIRITQDTSISTKYISFTGNIGPAPSQPTITLGGYITHQYNTTSKTYTIGAGHAANYILCNNSVSSVRADSITLAITKIVGLA